MLIYQRVCSQWFNAFPSFFDCCQVTSVCMEDQRVLEPGVRLDTCACLSEHIEARENYPSIQFEDHAERKQNNTWPRCILNSFVLHFQAFSIIHISIHFSWSLWLQMLQLFSLHFVFVRTLMRSTPQSWWQLPQWHWRWRRWAMAIKSDCVDLCSTASTASTVPDSLKLIRSCTHL